MQLVVADDGPGIPEPDRVAVFERFVRLDEGRSTDRSGAGLGLAIVAGVVGQHHGTVTVDDDPQLGGARFVVNIPDCADSARLRRPVGIGGRWRSGTASLPSPAMAVMTTLEPHVTAAASAGPVRLRISSLVRAGSRTFCGPDEAITGWHQHPFHQIEWARSGMAEVETGEGDFLLPPHQALWIPALTPHRATLHHLRSVSVLFAPGIEQLDAVGHVAVVAPSAVLREMAAYSARWPIDRRDDDSTAVTYFSALALVLAEALDDPLPIHLPRSEDTVVDTAMELTRAQIASATAVSISRQVGVSERTLRRRFEHSVGMSWHDYLGRARLLRAMVLLAQTDRSVLELSHAVGFETPSGFARAFRGLTGETPAAYRRRVTAD